MKLRVPLAILLVMALTLVGCSSGDDASPTTQATNQSADDDGSSDGGNNEGDTNEGTSDSGSTSGDLPPSASENFTVGIPQGWEIDILDEIGLSDASGAQLLYDQNAFDDIVAFYDQWIVGQSAEYARTEIDGDLIYQRLETPAVIITVTRNHEERGEVFTYLLIAGGTDA